MKTLEAPSKEENEIIATLSLLTMVIKSVPQPVLRKSFPEAGDKFLQMIEQFAESENQNVLRSVSEDPIRLKYSVISLTSKCLTKYFRFNHEFNRIKVLIFLHYR